MPARRGACVELLERRPAGQAGVDERDAALVGDDVAVDVAEAGHVDRQLAAQHTGRHLGDLRDSASCSWRRGRSAIVRAYGRTGSTRRPVTRSPGGVGLVRGRLVRRVAAAVVDPSDSPSWQLIVRPLPSSCRRGTRRRRCPTCSLRCSPSCAQATSSSSSTTTRRTARPPSPPPTGRRSSPRRRSRPAGSASRTPAGSVQAQRPRHCSCSSTPMCGPDRTCSTGWRRSIGGRCRRLGAAMARRRRRASRPRWPTS